jgi:cytochrome bd-type quinol oxidase subunit 2
MRSTYRVLAYALAVEVLVQAMAIAYAMAGLGKWVEDDHGVLTKKVADGNSLPFRGGGGFTLHGVNGMLIIPILVLLLLIISFFAKVVDGTKQALILLGLVVLQVILGIALHGVPYVAPLHALNAFGILVVAYKTGKSVSDVGQVGGGATA